jgi:hypothetical protein
MKLQFKLKDQVLQLIVSVENPGFGPTIMYTRNIYENIIGTIIFQTTTQKADTKNTHM